jgi:hypothetical protein
MVCDSTGKTAETLFNAVAVQFDIQNLETRYFTNVANLDKLAMIIEEARNEKNVIIAYTMILPEFCEYIESEAEQYDIPTIDILGPFITKFSQILDRQPQLEVGLNYKIDKEVFKRIECLDFNVRVDNGRDLNKLKEADIVLMGVSRTSKTPLSMYLAHYKYKVATIALSPEVIPPREIYEIPGDKIFGLQIEPSVLQKIRENRVKLMDFSQEVGYVKYERIVEELKFAERIMKEVGCRVIDITYKSIEETADEILDNLKMGKHKLIKG